MPKTTIEGITPVGGPKNTKVPEDGALLVFTNPFLRCPCKPEELQELFEFDGVLGVTCPYCKIDYAIPAVSYRWPPIMQRQRG